ncbi:nucleotidyltransferase domain-containing protein [Kitasatospora sp. NPDC059795]|uniref:nucleotidyltransferase domain-containing protein n=1 Tax=Kitasatospora sp. NPDC059795 TaxID=3346949 RepID=UPI003654A7F8
MTRDALAAAVRTALERCCPGSSARLRGSLAAGTADRFSDIDVCWVVPDDAFPACLTAGAAALARVRPVEQVRCDPDFLHSDRRRLLFVRFAGVPLFWRLDLDVRAASVADEPDYDTGNPAARADDSEWSRPASALANAVAAVKALARGRPDTAHALIARAFTRLGLPHPATGDPYLDIYRLAAAATRQDATLAPLAARVTALADLHNGPQDRSSSPTT